MQPKRRSRREAWGKGGGHGRLHVIRAVIGRGRRFREL